MSETTHPPIPPNCELIRAMKNPEGFALIADSCWIGEIYEGQNGPRRKVIACVAAQYWRIEQDRRHDECAKASWVDHHKAANFNFDVARDAFVKHRLQFNWEEADNNARAWLKWGGLE